MTNWLDSLPEVPGDPGTVLQFARRLGGAAEALDGDGSRLRSAVGSLAGTSWQGQAADQFASLSNAIATDLRAAGEACRDAAGVLSQYGSALEQAQQVRAAAQQQLDQAKVEAAVVNVALPMFSGVEDFNPAVRRAHQQAAEARQYVKDMAAAARAALEALAGLPVHMPRRAPKAAASAGWYDRYLGFGQDFGEGLYDGFKAQAMLGWNTSVGHLIVDPKGYLQFLQQQGDRGELVGKHPEEFGKSLIDWTDWTSGHPGRAAGELLPWLAATVLGGKVAAAGGSLGGIEDAGEAGWWLPPLGGGTRIGGRWYTEHALERMGPDTPEVRAVLERRTLARAEAAALTPGTPEFGQWWRLNHPDPRGIPPGVVEAEIAKPGTTSVRVITNKSGDVITVVPGD